MAHVYFDFRVNNNCWNLYESYGEICVGCGCCSSNAVTAYSSRIIVLQRILDHQMKFSNWVENPELRKIQEENVSNDINTLKNMIRYYKHELRRIKKCLK